LKPGAAFNAISSNAGLSALACIAVEYKFGVIKKQHYIFKEKKQRILKTKYLGNKARILFKRTKFNLISIIRVTCNLSQL